MAKTKEEIVLTAMRAWKEKDKSNEFWFKAIVEGAYNSGYTKAKQEAAEMVEKLDEIERKNQRVAVKAQLPSVEPEQKNGKWESVDDVIWLCSECKYAHSRSNYCPNCGARMDVKE